MKFSKVGYAKCNLRRIGLTKPQRNSTTELFMLHDSDNTPSGTPTDSSKRFKISGRLIIIRFLRSTFSVSLSKPFATFFHIHIIRELCCTIFWGTRTIVAVVVKGVFFFHIACSRKRTIPSTFIFCSIFPDSEEDYRKGFCTAFY